MSDFLVNLGANKLARQTINKLGLPIPLPQKLKRANGPLEERPLHDLPVIVGLSKKSELSNALARTLARAGASLYVSARDEMPEAYIRAGEAWARPPTLVDPGAEASNLKPHGVVFDASGLEGPEDLKEVYSFFHTWIRALDRCGRLVVLGRPPAAASTPQAAAASRALDGFTRCIAREVGKKGSTAQTVYVDSGAEERLEPVLRFILSSRSVYVSGQPIHVSAKVKADVDVPLTRPLEGKTALVTGAAQGIGNKTARALAREGAHVICMDRPDQGGPTSLLVRDIGGTQLLCDINTPDAPAEVVKLVEAQFGGLDIVVHNAGVTRDKTLGKMKEELWDLVLGVNLIALIQLNEALLPLLRVGGRIVCLSSIAGISGNMGQSNYAASKAGLIGYVQGLSESLAARGIAINAVAPGFIETKMTAAIPAATREVARRLCNLQQGGQPGDVAEAIAFLAGPGAAGLSGEVLRICGGNYVGA